VPDPAGLLISVCALAFTIASFWWLNARRSRIVLVGCPRSFARSVSGGRLHLMIPLSFYATGPTPAWIITMRLVVRDPRGDFGIPFVATRPGVQPKSEDERPLATQLVLAGRRGGVFNCEFIGPCPDWFEFAPPNLRLSLEAEVHRSWGRPLAGSLGEIKLRVDAAVAGDVGSYIAFDNIEPHRVNSK